MAHLEQSEFVGRPETVLRGAQQAQRVVAVALELQDGVDHVLEHPWAGEPAVLGDVADEDDRHVAVLRFDDQALCATPDLTDAARQGGRGGIVDGLDRVDDHELGFRGVDRGDDVRQRRLGVQPQVVADRSQPQRPSLDLVRALLGRDVQRRAAPGGEQLEQQRALADAGLTAEQRDRAGHEAAAQHTVEFDDRRGDRVAVLGPDVADRRGPWPVRREQRHVGAERADDVFDQRVPVATAGALP